MQVKAAIGQALTVTEFDKVRPSVVVAPGEAKTLTMQTNVVNGLLYTLNAAVPETGYLVNPLVTLYKFMRASVHMLVALDAKTPEFRDAHMQRAADYMKSGTENAVVGAVACIPAAGPYLAGAWAVKTLAYDARRA